MVRIVACLSLYIGGKQHNKHRQKRLKALGQGRGYVGKTIVAGILDRPSNTLIAQPVSSIRRSVLWGFIYRHISPETTIYTDDLSSYRKLPNHQSVAHSRGEYVRGEVHTQGIESAWAIIKRMHKGTYHSMSPKHLHRYVRELCARHNLRPLEPLERMAIVARAMVGKRLTWRELVAGAPAWSPLPS